MNNNNVDTFRDTPIRYLGYANEVGEAFRSFIGGKLVAASYGVATLYVVADATSKSAATFEKTRSVSKTLFSATDVFIWQMLASVIIPGFTINRLCKGTNYLLLKSVNMPNSTRNIFVTAIGLLAIPFIIKPIDKFVDGILDQSLRKFQP